MKPTSREFIVTTAVVAGGAAVWPAAAGSVRPEAAGEHVMFAGDPYLATVEDGPLGGSFETARQRALRYRTQGADRDQLVLGLEI